MFNCFFIPLFEWFLGEPVPQIPLHLSLYIWGHKSDSTDFSCNRRHFNEDEPLEQRHNSWCWFTNWFTMKNKNIHNFLYHSVLCFWKNLTFPIILVILYVLLFQLICASKKYKNIQGLRASRILRRNCSNGKTVQEFKFLIF